MVAALDSYPVRPLGTDSEEGGSGVFPGGLVVKTVLPLQGARVRPLVGNEGTTCCMLCAHQKKQKKRGGGGFDRLFSFMFFFHFSKFRAKVGTFFK